MLVATIPTEPHVGGARHRDLGKRRSRVGALFVGNRQQAVDLARIEAGQVEIVIETAQFL